MKRVVLIGAAIGFAVPMAFWALHFASGQRYLFGLETFLLWPSCVFLMATDGHEGSPWSWLVAAESVLANVLLYAVVAAIGYGVVRGFHRIARRA